jgi:Arc/MetJ family transcription regulator
LGQRNYIEVVEKQLFYDLASPKLVSEGFAAEENRASSAVGKK